MKNPARIAQMLIRGTGVLLLLLGIPIWTGNADGLVPLHMLLGFVLVLSLWGLAYLASQLGVSPRIVGLAYLWGLLAPILGLSQEHLASGNAHWLIQILHLLVGLVAIGIGEMLGAQLKSVDRSQRTTGESARHLARSDP